ncbi:MULTISPECIES: hypothetical protein [Citricoccus]|uniref:hypothetical protein n=1 Tax=Citricoccus TaxID=169133 RepID=UPI000255F00F|nr:hypothetical protein [Citricoccus sp. CH26A]
MPGFRLKSLARVQMIRKGLAAARLADTQPHAPAEQHRPALERALLGDRGGVHVLAAAGIDRTTVAQQLAGTGPAQTEADEVRAAEQALMLAVQARRRAERDEDYRDRQQRVLTDRAEQQAPEALAFIPHHPSGEHR